ncbi:hypothetical protein SERLADRAFT_397773, partial [Serpula lacrymans var. lacrymans S7.9]
MRSLFTRNTNGMDRSSGKTTDRKRRIKLVKSYAPDWIITIVLAIVFFALN